jgi:photosystem II stability/assembly factor-like uncharacterized protein
MSGIRGVAVHVGMASCRCIAPLAVLPSRKACRGTDAPPGDYGLTLTLIPRFCSSLVLALTLVVSLLAKVPAQAAASYDWPQFNGNALHSGNNTVETAITLANVATLQRLYQVILPAETDGSPVFLGGVSTAGSVLDLLFVTTNDGRILALNARSGAQIWSRQVSPGSCIFQNPDLPLPCFTTSSPVIDPSRQYVYSYGLDGKIHKYQVGDGTEISDSHWPEVATAKPSIEKESAALSIATSRIGTNYLYVTFSAWNDAGDYQGHVTAINLTTGTRHVFNTLCSNQVDVLFVVAPGTPDCTQKMGGIWGRSGIVYDPDTDRIYATVGNGAFDPANHDWGDSVLALHPDGTGVNGDPLDSYTPASYQVLQNQDEDLGSTAPAILPVPATSMVQHLAVQGGKDHMLRLLNLDNLSGQGGIGHTGGEIGTVIDLPQCAGSAPGSCTEELLTAPAVWRNPADQSTWVFVATYTGLAGMRLQVDGNGLPGLQTMWLDRGGTSGSGAGSSPLVANGVLYEAHSGHMQAFNPTTGALLWTDTTAGAIHWSSPILANGVLYITGCADSTKVCVGDPGLLTAYALPGPPVTWTNQTSRTSNSLQAVACISASVCEVAGVNGTLLGTTNSGAAWNAQASGTTSWLFGLSCSSASTCFAVGGNGTIRATTNGGSTWSSQASSTASTLRAVACPNTTNCIAVGDGGTVIATSNGGASWTAQHTSITTSLNAVACPSASTCYAAGNSGVLLTTTTGGASWTLHAQSATQFFYALNCTSATSCIVVGSGGGIFATNDGGTTWQAQGSNTSSTLHSIACASATTCTAMGSAGVIVTSSNGGITWTRQTIGAVSLNGAACPSVAVCFAVGDTGMILTSAQGAAPTNTPTTTSTRAATNTSTLTATRTATPTSTKAATNTSTPTTMTTATVTRTPAPSPGSWVSQTSHSFVWLKGVNCANSLSCTVVGDGGTILATSTGSSWGAQTDPSSATLYAPACPSSATCYAVGFNGVIIATTNGSAWTLQNSGTANTLYALACPGIVTCFAFGVAGAIQSTTNGGTWVGQSSGTSHYLYGGTCPSVTVCFAVGSYGTVRATTNGGNSWIGQSSGTSAVLRAITCPTTTICYAVGDSGTILTTVNGGASWTGQNSGITNSLRGVACISTSTCFAVGYVGTILATMNGGTTWTVQSSGTTSNLLGINCVSTGVCYAAGDAGTILRRS